MRAQAMEHYLADHNEKERVLQQERDSNAIALKESLVFISDVRSVAYTLTYSSKPGSPVSRSQQPTSRLLRMPSWRKMARLLYQMRPWARSRQRMLGWRR
jgi:hypothetical protein